MPTSRSGCCRPSRNCCERDARRVGGEDRARLHLRLDAGKHLLLEAEVLRHRLDDQVGECDAFALEIGDQAVERVANPAAVVAADLAVEFGGALDRTGERLRLHVGEADGEAMPRAPRGDVAAHRAGADHVDAAAVPFAVGQALELLAQEKHPDQIARRIGDQQPGERFDLALLHGVAVAAVRDPKIDQRIGRGVLRLRRPLGGFAPHPRRQEASRRRGAEQPVERALLVRLQIAADGIPDGGADMALLRHRIDQAERLGAAGALGLAGQHHGHRLDRADQARQPHRSAEARMQAEQHLGEAEARVVDGDALVAGQRQLESAAEAIAVDHRDGRQRQAVEPVQDGVAARQQRLDLRRVGDGAELRDVGAGDEAARLGRADHQPARTIAFELVERQVELGQRLAVQRVGAGALLVEQQPGDAVLVGSHPPMLPRRCFIAGLAGGERSEFEIARIEDVQHGLWMGCFAHAWRLKSLRSAWRHPGRHRCIRWRCRASSRAVSWR